MRGLENFIRKITRPISRRVMHMIGRSIITNVDDTSKIQKNQISVLKDERFNNIERFQQYGFTGVPLPGAEGIALFVNGGRDHGVIISVDDRRYRLKGLAQGEVAIYTDEGDKIHLKRGREIDIETTKLTITAGDAKQTMTSDGKFKFENSSDELISLIHDLVTDLEGGLVNTGIGPMPFAPATKTKLTQLKSKLAGLKG